MIAEEDRIYLSTACLYERHEECRRACEVCGEVLCYCECHAKEESAA